MMIGRPPDVSQHFFDRVAAVSIALLGLESGASLAIGVGFIEVPIIFRSQKLPIKL